MRFICDCGNEMELAPNEDIEEDERGRYVKIDSKKFYFWAGHDDAGVICKNCKKAIWYFA